MPAPSSTYHVRSTDLLLPHGRDIPWLLRDGANSHGHPHDKTDMDVEALVASGDCLISLATNLDQTTEFLEADEAARPQIEKVINTLLYLQRRYKLVRKTPEHRQ